MRYPPESEIHTNVTNTLARIAPGFTLMHFRAMPNHTTMDVTVCAKEGLNRLMFNATLYPKFCMPGRLLYIGVKTDCLHAKGLNHRVEMLMRIHPDAHIQFIDNEEDGDDALFGYVAYDDDYNPIAWAPIELDKDGSPVDDAPAHVTHTIPAGVEEYTNIFRVEEGDDPDVIV